MTGKSFALTFIAGLYASGGLLAESPAPKENPGKLSQTHKKQSASSHDAATAPRVLTVRDITIFTYQPAPTRAVDVRGLPNEGLARIAVNPQGIVTSVTILRSTGNRAFDTDAVDAFRRWRAIRGPAREIDLPVTAVTSGKKGMIRIPLSEGRLDVG